MPSRKRPGASCADLDEVLEAVAGRPEKVLQLGRRQPLVAHRGPEMSSKPTASADIAHLPLIRDELTVAGDPYHGGS